MGWIKEWFNELLIAIKKIFVTIAVEASLQKNGGEIILDLAEAATRGQNGLIEKLFSSSSQ